MKIVTVIGARPQFIKAAIVSRHFSSDSSVEEAIVHTGQHYDANMSDIFFNQLEIPRPVYNLQIGSSSHAKQTAGMLTALEEVFHKEKPDWVLVYGDTNSTLAAALAASKERIHVAHVEAGLRSFNHFQPEEINRMVTDQVSSLCLAPTKNAVSLLEGVGITGKRVKYVGDVMYDAALHFSKHAPSAPALNAGDGKRALVTIHRPENTDSPERLTKIVDLLVELSKTCSVHLPLHPRTKNKLQGLGLDQALSQSNVVLLEPIGYLELISSLRSLDLVLTDSGGLQKEAFFFGIPCVTLRDETEWTELIELGWNKLLPPSQIDSTKTEELFYRSPHGTCPNPEVYGEGDACRKILNSIKEF